MRSRTAIAIVVAVVVAGARPSAHRLDELLQAARIGIAEDRVELELDLTPGVAVADRMIAAIDGDRDGVFSSGEQRALMDQVMAAVALRADDTLLTLTPGTFTFPDAAALRSGDAAIRIHAAAPLTRASGSHRIHFDNRYQRDGSVYLANALVPESDRIAVTAQLRDGPQSELTIEYRVAPETSMNEHPLAAWESFYVIVGTSAAALIGMQFVVMTLADARRMARADTIGAFSTPTVAHMSAALIISALMSAPWHTLSPLPTEMAIAGLLGLFYSGFVVLRRARTQHGYATVWQDWMWYTILPSICYLTLAASAFWINSETELALFMIGLSSLALLIIGIHNAWDAVTHIVVSGAEGGGAS